MAICRLKRVAADNKGDISALLPDVPKEKNGKKVALIGGGPASLTVARDLLPLGYKIDLYDDQNKAGGFMRSQVPSFRLPEDILDEEIGYILHMGVNTIFNHRVENLKEITDKNYDAVFVATGAPKCSHRYRIFSLAAMPLSVQRISLPLWPTVIRRQFPSIDSCRGGIWRHVLLQ